MPRNVDRQLRRAGRKRKCGKLAVATVEQRVAAMRSLHRARGWPSPVDQDVRDLLRAARRVRASRGGQGKKRALTRDLLERLLAACGEDLRGRRDRALLLVAWASGGRRRSEVVRIEVAHLAAQGGEYTLRLPRGKVDQEGRGASVPVAGRAAEALREWLSAAAIKSGPVFRGVSRDGESLSGRALEAGAVTAIVKRRAELAGLDPQDFGAHSLRSGFLTQAGRDGIALAEAMKLSCHSDVNVAMGYHQAGAALNNPAARMAG